MAANEYLIEQRLYDLDPGLHKRFSESLFVLQKLLSDYLTLFPEYTDHSELHSLDVIDYCRQLMGEERINQMNADELYILLMGCYVHDIGMGVSMKDYEEFFPQIDFGDYFETHEHANPLRVIRKFHNELSACMIRKYAELFDIPSEKHVFAIMQTARGHRNADLFNEKDYPAELVLDNGNSVCLPYLAAMVRLADEVDVAKTRNVALTFDPENASTDRQRMENAKHEAIRKITIYTDRVELDVKTDDEAVLAAVEKLADTIQDTFDYCNKVVDERTDYEITQKKVIINNMNER